MRTDALNARGEHRNEPRFEDMGRIRVAFAGDRDIAVEILDFILGQGISPAALLVSDPSKASHGEELIRRCSYLETDYVLSGTRFRTPEALARLAALDLDYVVCVHFPYLVPPHALAVARSGFLNLHPAFLPFNRGWHTPSWSILDDTPAGATLHFMDDGIDSGAIVHQRRLDVSPADTAHSLYRRIKALEVEVFKEAWPLLLAGERGGRAQDCTAATTRQRAELHSAVVQRIELDERVRAGDLLRRLRALTTNSVAEAAYYEVGGKRYRVQVVVHEEVEDR